MTDFVRVNLNTGEIEVLFEVNDSMRFRGFIEDNQVFISDQITDWDAGRVHTQYGILNLETGKIQLFERQGFAEGHIDLHDKKVLMTEQHVTEVVNNEVIVFDSADLSSQFISLENRESMWARFSYDGNHIVTVNEETAFFRKYDFNGNIISEVNIEISTAVEGISEIVINAFEIFPLTENIYTIHSLGFPVERHIQFIRLP